MLRQITFAEFFEQFYVPFSKAHKRGWKLEAYICKKQLLPKFGEYSLNSISRKEIENWFFNLKEMGYAPATCNRYFCVLRSIFKYAESLGYIKVNKSPCLCIPYFKIPSAPVRALSQLQAMNLIKKLQKENTPQANAISLLLVTGARKSEILKAKWENVDKEKRLLIVPNSKTGTVRHIPLNSVAMEIINKMDSSGVWIFSNKSGTGPIKEIYPFWNKLRNLMGLTKTRIHDLRHTFASLLVQNGVTLYQTQKLLGHSTPVATIRYAHLNNSVLQACSENIVRILNLEDKKSKIRRVIEKIRNFFRI